MSYERYRERPAVQVAFWLGGLDRVPDVEGLQMKLGCSRATAYRWWKFAREGGDPVLMPEFGGRCNKGARHPAQECRHG